ncbi:MAG: F0F1 ATP synthase subunit A [Alphaproteobacteria bacterium]
MASPLKQFDLTPVGQIGGFYLTNSTVWMVITLVAIPFFFWLAMKRHALVPGRLQSTGEILINFVADMIRSVCGPEGMKYFPFVFALFTFVLFGNLFGMLPLGTAGFTITSHIAVTFALAMLVFIGVTVIGIMRHGTHFFSLFLPHGVPGFLVPIIIPIEVFSYCIRPVTLAVRLFANMTAGHILLKMFAIFTAAFVGGGGILVLGGIAPFAMASVFILFEIFVAFIQAYIFAILTCVYLNDAINLH